MYNIKIVYEYDGTRYFGFQRQINKITVQGEIEKVLRIVCKEEINLISAGRTDRGVHAKCQVSNFKTNLKLDNKKWLYILNRSLPNDIKIKKVSYVKEDFNSRFDAKYREYEYYITWKKNPFKVNYFCFSEKEINFQKFYEILKILKGKHDFKNFMLSDNKKINTIREIYKIEVKKINKSTIKIIISANAFLKSQIRIIIGIALDIYFNKIELDRLKNMLEQTDKEFKKQLADPQGLYLSKIKY